MARIKALVSSGNPLKAWDIFWEMNVVIDAVYKEYAARYLKSLQEDLKGFSNSGLKVTIYANLGVVVLKISGEQKQVNTALIEKLDMIEDFVTQPTAWNWAKHLDGRVILFKE